MSFPPLAEPTGPGAALLPPSDTTGEVGWLLESFLSRAPRTLAAVLASPDGLPMSSARLPKDETASLAAAAASLHSTARTAGNISAPPGGRIRHIIVDLDQKVLFIKSTHHGQGPGRDTGQNAGLSAVGALLVVLADKTADARLLSGEMSALIASVAEHLGTTARTAPLDAGVDSGGDAGSGVGLGTARTDAGTGDER
ncbi:roadblock/LC7 domain-containing protein [Actinomadura syzygii]|nr:roadblock/LC7 domain-containing protein [Actinomadura syzygii]